MGPQTLKFKVGFYLSIALSAAMLAFTLLVTSSGINCAVRTRLARAKIRPKYIPFVYPGGMDQELLFLFNVFL